MRHPLPVCAAAALLTALAVHGPALAEVRLAGVFGDHMVLQRDAPIRVWGEAAPSERVRVSFRGRQRQVTASREGRWQVLLPRAPAGGPHELRVQASNTVVLHDVLVGEVWVASGQSNMEWALRDSDNGPAEVAAADWPQIRHARVAHRTALRPAEDLAPLQWQPASPATAGGFSAVAFYFARRLHRETGVPVGIVNSSWGGSHLETWTSRGAALADPDLAPHVRQLPERPEALLAQRRQRHESLVGAWQPGVELGEPDPSAFAAPGLDDRRWPELKVPGLWEDQGLPGIDGVVWLRRRIALTAEQAAGPATLFLGPVDDCDDTWVNGRRVGGLCGWDTPRQWPVPAGLLRAGENLIALRVTDTGGGGGPYGDAAVPRLQTPAGAVPLAGSWKARVAVLQAEDGLDKNAAPTLLFNGMVHPLLPLRIRGVIWYQGESNVGRAARYGPAFRNLITDWRRQWGQGAFPFHFVQLASFLPVARNSLQASAWSELRDAQAQALALPRTGMVVTTDVGDADDIHPRRKQPVGERLAALALAQVHGRRLEASGPVLRAVRYTDGRATLHFGATAGGLAVRGGGTTVEGFAIASDDGRFLPARAELRGDTVTVWRDGLTAPAAVRYAWVDNPQASNLINGAGLPASPFRTDRWPLSTAGARFEP